MHPHTFWQPPTVKDLFHPHFNFLSFPPTPPNLTIARRHATIPRCDDSFSSSCWCPVVPAPRPASSISSRSTTASGTCRTRSTEPVFVGTTPWGSIPLYVHKGASPMPHCISLRRTGFVPTKTGSVLLVL